MSDKSDVLCIGEILWDALPSGLFLGGAPLNVCFHLNQFGVDADIASRVGKDRLGKEALQRIENKEISTGHIQVGEEAETGFVQVDVESGNPVYEIVKPAAWDFLRFNDTLEKKAGNSWGLVFGSLAQRHPVSRATIQKLWRSSTRKILDINLRPPHVDKKIIRDSLEVADIIKMNKEELDQLSQWYSLPDDPHRAVEALASEFKCPLICVTQGAGGAVMYEDNSWYRHPGYRAVSKDTVGAGDAFLAAMIFGLQHNKEREDILEYANAAGSFVAQKDGATPEYSLHDIEELARRSEE